MSKIVLPDGTPANKTPGIVGPSGETLSVELPENAPRSLIVPVMFINKLSEEVEFSGAAVVPLKSFVKFSKKGEQAIEALYTELFLQIFATELKEKEPEKLEGLETAKDLYVYMVSNYRIQVMPLIGINTLITASIEDDEDTEQAEGKGGQGGTATIQRENSTE